MKIKNILVAVCGFFVGMAFLNVGIINVNATEPVPDVKAATTVSVATGEPGRSVVRPQGGVGNVKYVEVVPVAMPAETADGFGLYASRILEDAMAGRPFGTGNRITASSLILSSAPGNCWVLVHVTGEGIALVDFAVKTKSSDSGNTLGSITYFDTGRQYGPLAVLVSNGEKIISGPSTRTGEEIWFFARPPLFGGGEGNVAQVDAWINYQNSLYSDFAVTIGLAPAGKAYSDMLAWTVLSTKSTPAAPFVKMGADGQISLVSDADSIPRCGKPIRQMIHCGRIDCAWLTTCSRG
jgi:hypothetical protein